jgi:phospholipid/cholesterol/gamma-HCH transport system substrate-binding protein
MESRTNLAIKAGAFVLVGLVLAGAIIFGVNSWRFLQPGYELELIFESASGVLVGAPVKFAGVEVGEVIDLKVERDEESPLPQVWVRIWMPGHLIVRSDDQAWIGILGLLGEKYVEILAGSGQGSILASGDQLVGTGIVSELEFTQRLSRTLTGLDEVMAGSLEFLNNKELPERLLSSLKEAEELSGRLKQTAQEADSLLGQLDSLSTQTSETLERLHTWTPWIALSIIALPIVVLVIGFIN